MFFISEVHTLISSRKRTVISSSINCTLTIWLDTFKKFVDKNRNCYKYEIKTSVKFATDIETSYANGFKQSKQ